MKNLFSKTTKISFRIIAMFTVIIFVSFIPDYLHSFFDDWYCVGTGVRSLVPATQITYEHYEFIGGCDYWDTKHNPTWHWGYRHWLFFSMGVCLFIVQVVDIINFIDKEESK